ncbi:MAG: glucose 1-dehydrogenase [Bacillota bacterium]|nr:glucose 1-dehydrogenase [Bacillota bacterium]
MKRLVGKVALVTGAGREKGIGFTCARRLAEEGASVALADLAVLSEQGRGSDETENQLYDLTEIISDMGVGALAIEVDVTDPDSVQKMIEQVKDKFGRLDILVNNAGTIIDPAPLALTDPEAWRKTIEVNLTGTMLCCRAAAPLMMCNEEGGKIINMSSRAARSGAIWMHAYCASKAGVIGLTRSMSLELAPFKICVNALCPGEIDTEMKRWGWGKEATIKGKTVEEIADEAAKATPLGRVGTAEDVAAAVAFFASPDADYMTGEILNITGGNGIRPLL